jgi:hypothetical protein
MGYTRRNGVGLRQNPMSPAAPGTAPGKAEPLRLTGLSSSSPGRIRTYDPPVNSRKVAGHISIADKKNRDSGNPDVPPDVLQGGVDPGLDELVRYWPRLPSEIQAAITTLVRTARSD